MIPRELVKFGLLMWKNWLYMIRKPLETLFLVVFPLAIIALLVFLRFIMPQKVVPNRSYLPLQLDIVP